MLYLHLTLNSWKTLKQSNRSKRLLGTYNLLKKGVPDGDLLTIRANYPQKWDSILIISLKRSLKSVLRPLLTHYSTKWPTGAALNEVCSLTQRKSSEKERIKWFRRWKTTRKSWRMRERLCQPVTETEDVPFWPTLSSRCARSLLNHCLKMDGNEKYHLLARSLTPDTKARFKCWRRSRTIRSNSMISCSTSFMIETSSLTSKASRSTKSFTTDWHFCEKESNKFLPMSLFSNNLKDRRFLTLLKKASHLMV